jgi:hypothetical protein
MLFYNARSCYPGPGGLVDSVTDSGGGLQGSYPHFHFGTSHIFAFSIHVLFHR